MHAGDDDIVLSVNHIDKILEKLTKARALWYFIGKGIDCQDDDLGEIKKSCSNDDKMCLHEMLKARIQSGKLTRSKLCISLRAVERDDVAQEIEALKL